LRRRLQALKRSKVEVRNEAEEKGVKEFVEDFEVASTQKSFKVGAVVHEVARGHYG
jgi:hypothetical protein